MKRLFLVANWKSHKTADEAKAFFQTFRSQLPVTLEGDKHVIFCPPSILLSTLSEEITTHRYPFTLSLGAQNVSPFAEGSYTGEEAASQIADFAQFVIIGHSERREEFGETDEMLERKVVLAKQYHLEPIYCVQSKDTVVPEGIDIIAYEPLDAIGTGNPVTPETAADVASYFKREKHIPTVLYGGSVTSDNVHEYTGKDSIDGVLVGTESLDPDSFIRLIIDA